MALEEEVREAKKKIKRRLNIKEKKREKTKVTNGMRKKGNELTTVEGQKEEKKKIE